jgi:hypothetical protein
MYCLRIAFLYLERGGPGTILTGVLLYDPLQHEEHAVSREIPGFDSGIDAGHTAMGVILICNVKHSIHSRHRE